MTSLAFLAALSAPSALCAAFAKKKYEEILPLSVMGIVLVLYLFGLADALKTGFYVLLACVPIMYLVTVVKIWKTKEIKSFIRHFVTPGTIIFASALALLTLWNRGKLAMAWDEFSHWVDIAKVMTTIHDFGTSPASGSAFQSYPPAMTLFQYFLQMLNQTIHPFETFSEWRVYLAYQVFCIAVLMPLFRGKTFRSPIVLTSTVVVVFVSPLLFYADLYASVYIDAFLGVLSGAGFAEIVFCKRKDLVYSLYIWMLCAVLVLAKDAGMLFAVFLAAAYLLDALLCNQEQVKNPVTEKIGILAMTAIAVALPKFLWKKEIVVSGAAVSFSKSVELKSLILLLLGRDDSYRSTVVDNFRNAMFEKQVTLGNISISFNYAILLITGVVLVYLLYRVYACRNCGTGKGTVFVFSLAAAQLVLYSLGLCIIYAFKFSEYEAVRLASFTRYIHIGFLSCALFLLAGLLWCMETYLQKTQVKEVLVLYALLVIFPLKPIADLANRETVTQSIRMRKPYQEISGKILSQTPEGSKVYLVSQESTGLDYWVLRFSVRPNRVNENYSWSIGESFYEGDVWTKAMTAEQWQALLADEYDYVALYKINDYFLDNFSQVFENPETIANNTVYTVDKTTGKLTLSE